MVGEEGIFVLSVQLCHHQFQRPVIYHLRLGLRSGLSLGWGFCDVKGLGAVLNFGWWWCHHLWRWWGLCKCLVYTTYFKGHFLAAVNSDITKVNLQKRKLYTKFPF